MDRQPCPYRVFDDVGNGFAMGTIAGSVWHMFRGAKNAPKGERLRNGFRTVRQRAPILGGNFAVFSGLFSGFDCILTRYRGKEDLLNPLAAGFMSGAMLAFRGGTGTMIKSGIVAGTLIGLMEVIALSMQNAQLKQQMQDPKDMEVPPPPPLTGQRLSYMFPKHREREFDFIAGMQNTITGFSQQNEKLNFL